MSATFTEILKSVPFANIFSFAHDKGEVKEEFYLMTFESGSAVYLNPKKNIAQTVYIGQSGNAGFVTSYSHISECIYIWTLPGMLVEFDTNSFQTKYYSFHAYVAPSSNSFTQVVPMGQSTQVSTGVNPPHFVLPSQDGNVWFGTIRVRSVPCLTKFDVTTKQFTYFGLADKEYEHLWGKPNCLSWSVGATAGTLQGTYSEYVYDDSMNSLHTTILAEISANGVTWNNTERNDIYLHYEDRDISSATRRIFAQLNGSWKIMDIKNPSVFLNSQTGLSLGINTAWASTSWIDQTGSPIDNSAWPASGVLSTFEAVTVPSDFSLFYSRVRQVGRYAYEWGDYCNNQNFFYHYAYHPTSGHALYPDTFNKASAWQNNGTDPKVYKCNFGGLFGFSTNDELVVAVRNNAGNTGYHRPDTHTWTVYDFVADPNGYVIREVNVDDPDDPDWIGVATNNNIGDVIFLDQTWKNSNLNIDWVKSAINPIYAQVINPDRPYADLTIEYTPDSSGSEIYSKSVENIPTLTGIINSVFFAGSNHYVFFGQFYSGIVAGTFSGTFSQDSYFGEVISIYGTVKFGNKYVAFGYLNNVNIIDATSWPPTITNVSMGAFVNQSESAFARTSELVFCGTDVRESDYQNDYCKCGYTDGTTAYNLPNRPNEFNPQTAITLRQTTFGLPNENYSDAEVETQVLAYLTANPGSTRLDVINMFLDTSLWRMLNVSGYDNKLVFALQRRGVSALRGIRINDQADLLGTWYDETYNVSTDYPSCLYLDKSDLSTLLNADYKKVQFQVAGLQGVTNIGRVFVSTDYLVFVNNESETGYFRVISKTNLETAATTTGIITSFDSVFTIALSTGGYLGNTSSFTGTDRYRNIQFLIGNDLYVSCYTTNTDGGNRIIGYKINLATGTITPFLTNATGQTLSTTLNYDASSDKLLVARGTQAWEVNSFTSETLPIIIS